MSAPDRQLPELESLPSYLRSRAGVKPFRPLTVQQSRVADLLARGWGYKRIGFRLRMSPRTVQHHVHEIAGLLPDDDLPAGDRVRLWAGCVAWDKIRLSGKEG